MEKIACITGATSGIGKCTALKLAAEGHDVIIIGRRKNLLKSLAEEIINLGRKCHILPIDVRVKSQVFNAIESLPEEWRNIEILVNNAGLASGLSTIDEGEIDDWEKMIDTNLKGLLYVSRAVIPIMKNHKHGHIINIGSTAGKEVYLKGNVYCATKHAVDALTKAFRMDLLPFGIKVTGICPGMVATEFSEVRFHGDKDKARKVYEGFAPLLPEDIANVISFALHQPTHVCINDLVITCTAQANSTITIKDNT